MKRFFILCYALFALFLGQPTTWAASPWHDIANDFKASLNSASRGATMEQAFPFGTVRTLSCRTGFQQTGSVLAGVNISLKSGWKLRRYHLETDTPSTVQTIPLIPLKTNAPWDSDYTGDMIIPIVLAIPPDTPTFSLKNTLSLTVCSPDGAYETQKVIDTLPLFSNESYPTAWCGRLQTDLQTAALPADRMNVTAYGFLRPDNTIRTRLSFPDKVSYLTLQPAGKIPFDVTETRLNGRQATLTILPRTDTPVQPGQTVSAFVKTNGSSYAVAIPVETDPLPRLPDPLPIGTALLSGLLIFMLSPVWALWLSPPNETPEQYRSTLRLYQVAVIAALGVILLLWLLGFFPAALIRQPLFPWLLIPALLTLLFYPTPKPIILFLLMIALPKPFWDSFINITPAARIGLTLYWAFCLLLPLWIWSAQAPAILAFFKQLRHEKSPAYPTLVRLPYWLLIAWIGTGLIATIHMPMDNHPPAPGQTTLIQVTEPVCPNCVADTVFILKDTVFQDIAAKHSIQVRQWDSRSPAARSLMARAETDRLPLYVLVLPDNREIYLPQPLTLNRLHSFLEHLLGQ